MAPETSFQPLHPKVVLAVAAHPDDLESGVGGTVARWASEGADVFYLILTNGNKGSADRKLTCDELCDIRRDEQRAAAKILGVKEVLFCDYEDGLLQASPEVKCDVARVIRKVKPEVVLTMDPTLVYSALGINHSDHRAAGQATIDAVYPLARDHLSFPELLHEGLEPHKVTTLLLTNFEKHNFSVDISAHMERKLQALAEHKSQAADFDMSPAWVRQHNQKAGAKAGVAYAEEFIRIEIPG